MVFIFIAIIILCVIIVYCIKNHVVIHFKSFFKKGFRLNNNKYGCYSFTRQTTALGKTLSCITFILDLVSKQNLKVITNVKSFADNYKSFCIYEDNFYSIVDGFKSGKYDKSYIIFYDEIFTLLEKGKLNKSILSFISQLRKRELYLVTTAQEWLEINVTFRRYVRYQIDCSMVSLPFFNCALSINKVNDGYNMAWDNLQNEYIAPRLKTSIRKCSIKIANSYDTFEVIKDS